MKTILSLLAFVALAAFQTGCSSEASMSHDGRSHGVSASAGPGAGAASGHRGAGVGVGAGSSNTGVGARAY